MSSDYAILETSSLDVVLSQIFESIADDPMRLVAEVNRLLKPGSTLILTVANIASARSLHTLLRDGTPYVSPRFSSAGNVAHHREYTSSELETPARAGGFGQIPSVTRDIFWKPLDALIAEPCGLRFQRRRSRRYHPAFGAQGNRRTRPFSSEAV